MKRHATKKIRLSAQRAAKRSKRFAVFSGDRFYPNGGWDDHRSNHATLAEARRAPAPGDWWQIVDLATGQVVERNT